MSTWEKSLEIISTKLSVFEFKTWIKTLNVEENNDLFTIFCKNEFTKRFLLTKYQKFIKESLAETRHNNNFILDFKVVQNSKIIKQGAKNTKLEDTKQSSGKYLKPKVKKLRRNQSELDQELLGFQEEFFQPKKNQNNFGLRLKSEFVFDRFVVGKQNQVARSASMQVSQTPGKVYNPLFIYGGSGLGKTHLLQAIGNNALSINENYKVIYISAERFVKDYVKSLQLNSIDDFQSEYRSADLLLIDDIQFFSGKDGTQEEFFHTFNALQEKNKQIVITSDKYPNEINNLEERLVSRFGQGLTVEVDMPDEIARMAILKNKAELLNIRLSNQVAAFISKHVRTNIRELEGALNRVNNTSKFNNTPITVDLAKDCLKDVIKINDKKIKIDNIQKVVADFYKIRFKDLLSTSRSRNITRPRQIAMSITRELTSHSLPEIGSSFGGRDHTTVMHAVKTITKLRTTNTLINDEYSLLIDKIMR